MRIDEDPSILFQPEVTQWLQSGWIKNNDMIGLINVNPQIDGLAIHPQEGHDRCSSPFNPKSREGLDIEVLMEKGDGKHLGCHHSSLTPSSMKSNFDHRF
jgi:hypothetical protein